MEDEFLDNEEELDESGYYNQPMGSDDEESEDDDGADESQDSNGVLDREEDAEAEERERARMTENEIWLKGAYDSIVKAAQNSKETYLQDGALTLLNANPAHSSSMTRSRILMDLFQKQGHNRMVNSIYTPDTPLRGKDVEDLDQLDNAVNSEFNTKYTSDAKEYIARFVDYLASRDLSKDDTKSRKRKQRQIPAFIIFMFSSGMYELVMDCPTMPEEYSSQITHALQEIVKSKYDVVEALAIAYENAGRPALADKVRKMQLAWFLNEPAQLKSLKAFKNLEITDEDVQIYKKFRSTWNNITKSITQESISDLIEVVEDKDAGIYRKLKDKTRSDAIADVKQELKEWSKKNKYGADLASGIIWKDTEKLKS